MRLLPPNIDNINHNTRFKGKVPNIDDLTASKRFANCALDGLWDNLANSIQKKHPNLIKNINGIEYIPDDTPSRRIVSSLKCFFGMPIDIIDSVAKKFPNSKLNNAEFLKKYRDFIQQEENIRAFQGLQKNGSKFAKEHMAANGLTEYPTGACTEYCESICNPVTNKFIEQLNGTMADKVVNYDTK